MYVLKQYESLGHEAEILGLGTEGQILGDVGVGFGLAAWS